MFKCKQRLRFCDKSTVLSIHDDSSATFRLVGLAMEDLRNEFPDLSSTFQACRV